MKNHTAFRKLMTLSLLTVGAAGLVLADHGGTSGGGNSGGGTSGGGTSTRLKTPLAGPAIAGVNPTGEAEFRQDSSHGRTSLKVEVEHVKLPTGEVLDVTLTHGGTPAAVGKMTLNAFGEAELDLESQNGDVVPVVVKGDTITVTDDTTTTTIVIGSF